jgi:hypothetical protein
MGDAIKYLYSQFILRDVLSFITPGAIVTIAALLLFLHPHEIIYLSRSIHWIIYIPIFGVFYMVGFAIQCLGDLIGFIRFTPYGEDKRSFGRRRGIFSCKYVTNRESIIWWQEEEKELSKFYDKVDKEIDKNTGKGEGIKQGHERMVVMKQMCANGFMAIFIAIIFILVYFYCPWIWINITLGVLLAIVLLGSLFWGYRVHMLKQNTRETIFMKRRKGQGGG